MADLYRSWYPEVVRWMARFGLTVAEIASEIGVTSRTLNRWRLKYPDLDEALNDGRDLADARVEAALYSRAVGVEKRVTVLNRNGDSVTVDLYEKPDVTACIFWLKNRRRDRWTDTARTEHTGRDGGPIEVTDADRKRAEDILTAQILEEAERIARGASEG